MSNTWRFKPGNPEYERYIHSSQWRQTADKRLELDEHICCVCGGKATDVHHLTYDRFGNEAMDDLVSLCRKCHGQAESFYDPAVTAWAMDEVKPNGNNFMAAMRVDALKIAPMVFDYLKAVRGYDFDSLMRTSPAGRCRGKEILESIAKSRECLCRSATPSCVEDRRTMMLEASQIISRSSVSPKLNTMSEMRTEFSP
jgi:hypothetical protein